VAPRTVKQIERRFGFRTAVDEIADAKQAVTRRIEADIVQQRPQRVETAVQVADDEIAAGGVGGVAAELGSGAHAFMVEPVAGGNRLRRFVCDAVMVDWR